MARTLQEMTESHIGRQAYRTIELAVEVERLELLVAELTERNRELVKSAAAAWASPPGTGPAPVEGPLETRNGG